MYDFSVVSRDLDKSRSATLVRIKAVDDFSFYFNYPSVIYDFRFGDSGESFSRIFGNLPSEFPGAPKMA